MRKGWYLRCAISELSTAQITHKNIKKITSMSKDACDRDRWSTEHALCVYVGFSTPPNEIKRQAKSFRSYVQHRLKVRVTDSADAFYSPEQHQDLKDEGLQLHI